MKPFKRWEIALTIGLFAAILCGAASAAAEPPLEDKLVRLHVVAASDKAADQALKLRVRDEVLAFVSQPLADTTEIDEAMGILGEQIAPLEAHLAAFLQEIGSDQSVTVTLGEDAFPTKHYDGFALPAGPYQALCVVLDGGGGQNWWCVVFPPLCTATSIEELGSSEALGLSKEDVALITMENQEYIVKFKILEWLGALRNKFVK